MNRLTYQGSKTKIGCISVPFLADNRLYRFLNMVADFNRDGVWQNYTTAGGTQAEWVVKNMPVPITPTTYSFYFPLVDSSITSGSRVNVRAVVSSLPIDTDARWSDAIPPDAIAFDKAVNIQAAEAQNHTTQKARLVNTGAWRIGNRKIAFLQQITPGDDITLASLFYRPDVPDTPQGVNTCVAHALANSLVWLALKHGFIGLLVKPVNDTIDPYDVTTEAGVNQLGWDLNRTYENRGAYTQATGVKPEDIIPGVIDFIKQLPVEIKRMPGDGNDFSGQGVFDAIKDALKEGCGVGAVFEVPGRSLHMVTVIGFADIIINTTPYRMIAVHDPNTPTLDDLYAVQGDKITINNFPYEGKLYSVTIDYAIKACYKKP